MPSCFKLSSALLLAAMCFLIAEVVSAEQMTTCDSDRFVVHRLNCDYGVINVQQALYGRSSSLVCSDGRPPQQLANTQCERQGTTDELSSRCNGKKTCVVNTDAFRNPDPCDGTFKYLQTNFTCLPAITVVACEESLAHLFCDVGQVISVYGADYGRRDRTTCTYKRPESQIQNVDCLRPTELVASRCNGENSCTVAARNNVFGDPCGGTYKYLEVAYTCVYPETAKTSSSTL
uniref:SUEL-type lectin domain-containing protein n=2 Tax=Hippocampus comes TaxID=109280 RepID=A0A3Q3DTX7_HIPCM